MSDPFCIDWGADGKLLIVTGDGRLLCREDDGLSARADLSYAAASPRSTSALTAPCPMPNRRLRPRPRGCGRVRRAWPAASARARY